MVEAAAEKGYAATTIADVVARARVSRRTFYEHFEDKDDCFLAAYDASADLLMDLVSEAVDAKVASWSKRIEAGVRTYLHTLASEPALTRLFLVEILAAGPEALARRRGVHHRFAELVRGLVEAHREEMPAGWTIDMFTANALIGAINELVLLSVEEGAASDSWATVDTSMRLMRAALAPAEPDSAPAGEDGICEPGESGPSETRRSRA
jgi:AcrR family transcriptional regulator